MDPSSKAEGRQGKSTRLDRRDEQRGYISGHIEVQDVEICGGETKRRWMGAKTASHPIELQPIETPEMWSLLTSGAQSSTT